MKLLLDQNLSHYLIRGLSDLFPGSVHVRDVALAEADDLSVWEYCKVNGFVVVSKDSDFHQLAFVLGPPPKAIWLRIGNCTTAEIEAVLRESHDAISAFLRNPVEAFLVLQTRGHR